MFDTCAVLTYVSVCGAQPLYEVSQDFSVLRFPLNTGRFRGVLSFRLSIVLRSRVEDASFSAQGVSFSTQGCFVFELRVFRFRLKVVSFSSLGCFVFD